MAKKATKKKASSKKKPAPKKKSKARGPSAAECRLWWQMQLAKAQAEQASIIRNRGGW